MCIAVLASGGFVLWLVVVSSSSSSFSKRIESKS